MDNNDYVMIHNLPVEHQYEALEIYINSRLIDKRSLTHNEIIAIGNKLRQLSVETDNEKSIDHDDTEYVDKELNKLKSKLDRKHSDEIEKLTNQFKEEKTRELDEMKTKYETLIDRITELHKQSETTKLNTQQRKFETELKQKLQHQSEQLEQQRIEIMEKEREQYYEKFCRQFDKQMKEAIEKSKLEQKEQFEAEKKHLITELEDVNETRQNIILKELQDKLQHVEHLLKSRYRLLFNEYQSVCDFLKTVERDYQELQTEFQRFINSTGGYFHSDYLLKLKFHALENCQKNVKSFKSTLTEKLFTPEDFERCHYK